jgi:hypothetical protein
MDRHALGLGEDLPHGGPTCRTVPVKNCRLGLATMK